ncbi:SRPBCC domain-containing protein [Nonomuraea jiangxiensis]|uniref:Uncharacterized conserved protein YndB, AHSA1/START domain n=1 Tax=Nonomuraea jiangxiensis TaxID=633440 RepID=A0A1G9D697_9ACTN|nr:SRPBCC domain-containing protein [Nonomuraea jiangxiensis]SDK59442.1 Uncharacterized conserved protein YndB, AHSA1/START domain [Nonomuraea jiangxiensis]
MTVQDRIEREISIEAPLERVWDLITETGWWVGDGDRTGQQRRRDGDLEVVEDPKYGAFPMRVVSVDPRRYVSYRWASGFPGDDPVEGNSTLVEFWLSEQDSGTLVRVVESGFGSLAVTDEARESSVEGNTQGWASQLDLLKERAESVSV